MENWLSELVRTNRLKSLEGESSRPAPWEGRTRAELIYGRERNDEEPSWNWDGPSAIALEAKVEPSSSSSPEVAPAPKPVVAPPAVDKKPAFDKDKAVKYLEENAADDPTGKCAKSVRKALQHAGFNLPEHPEHAKDYGGYLEWGGLSKVDKFEYEPQKGDIAVIQPYETGKSGHIQIFTGERWASDILQNPKWFYPGEEYRRKAPQYEIYR